MRIQRSRNSNGEVQWDAKKPSTIDINYLSIDISKLSDKHFNYKTLAIMSLYSTPHNGYMLLDRDILFDSAREDEYILRCADRIKLLMMTAEPQYIEEMQQEYSWVNSYHTIELKEN